MGGAGSSDRPSPNTGMHGPRLLCCIERLEPIHIAVKFNRLCIRRAYANAIITTCPLGLLISIIVIALVNKNLQCFVYNITLVLILLLFADDRPLVLENFKWQYFCNGHSNNITSLGLSASAD